MKNNIKFLLCIILFILTLWGVRHIGHAINDNDITSSLTSVIIKIDGEELKNGETINVQQDLELQLSFMLDITVNKANTYTYQLPEQFVLVNEILDKELQEDNMVTGTFSISKDGLITINLNQDYVDNHDYSSVNLNFKAEWQDGENGQKEIDFGNQNKVIVDLDYDTNLSITKSHSRLSEDYVKANYQIQVTSYTEQHNVKITDTMVRKEVDEIVDFGSELVKGENITITVKDKYGTVKENFPIVREIENNQSLDLLLDEFVTDLNPKDTILIEYPMIYPTIIRWDQDVKNKSLIFENTATVTSDENSEPITAFDDMSYAGNKKNVINKSIEIATDDSLITKWKIEFNRNGYYILTNEFTITDTLQSSYLSYDTTQDFTIDVYTYNNKYVRTDTIPWSSVLSSDGRSWTLKPQSVDEGKNYKYYINYYTKTQEGYPTTEILRNLSEVRYAQHETPIEATAIINNIDFGLKKEGSANEETETAEWTIDHIIYPGTADIKGVEIREYIPQYTTINGEKKYAQIVDKNNNVYTGSLSSKYFTPFMNSAMDIEVLELNGNEIYTDNEEFATLKDCYSQITVTGEDITRVKIISSNVVDSVRVGLDLPGASGKYANGYIIRIKLRTLQKDIKPGTEVVNKVETSYFDIAGKELNYKVDAKVVFGKSLIEKSIDIETTPEYDNIHQKVNYESVIDTNKDGFLGANKMKWVIDFDERLIMEDDTFTIKTDSFHSGNNIDTFKIHLYEDLTYKYPSTKIGPNTYKQELVDVYDSGGIKTKLEVITTVDNENHQLILEFNAIPTQSNDEKTPIKYTINYTLSLAKKDYGLYDNVKNKITVYGNEDDFIYGERNRALSFANSILEKKYTIREDEDIVDFEIRINLDDNIQQQSKFIIEDVMSSNLIPDVDNLQVQLLRISLAGNFYYFPFENGSTLYNIYQKAYNKPAEASFSIGWPIPTLLNVELDLKEETLYNYVDALIKYYDAQERYTSKVLLVITYSSKVNGPVGSSVNVSNSASLKGYENASDESGFKHIIQGSGGTTSGMSKTITIKKQDALTTDSQIKMLSGAEYKIYDTDKNEIASGVTDETGTLIFGASGVGTANCQFEKYKPYYLIEVKAPEGGYVIDKHPYYFYINDPNGLKDNGEEITEQELDELTKKGYNAINMNETITRTNSKDVSIMLTKVNSLNNKVLRGAEFTIYDDINCTQKVKVSSYVSNGNYLLTGLSKNRTYYMKETTVPNNFQVNNHIYEIVIDEEGNVTIDGEAVSQETNSFFIKNVPSDYKLPTTGGLGIIPTIVIGITFILLGITLLINSVRRELIP